MTFWEISAAEFPGFPLSGNVLFIPLPIVSRGLFNGFVLCEASLPQAHELRRLQPTPSALQIPQS